MLSITFTDNNLRFLQYIISNIVLLFRVFLIVYVRILLETVGGAFYVKLVIKLTIDLASIVVVIWYDRLNILCVLFYCCFND